jgi:hypothetical protein
MRKHLASISFLRLSLAICSLLVVLSAGAYVASAQSGCAPPSGSAPWPRGSTVYVTVDSSITGTAGDQVSLALTGWNAANTINNSGVRFVIGPPPYDGAPVLLITNGTVYQNPTGNGYSTAGGTVATDVGALTERNGYNSTGQLINATITLNTANALANPGCDTCGPFYDPNALGYDTVFLKILLHEMGHTMGLGEAPGTPGLDQIQQNSVMNQVIGSCPNDACDVGVYDTPGGNLPTQVTDCDNSSVNGVLWYEYLASNGGIGGDGNSGDGSGGGGYSPCTEYYWVYYESYDGGQTWEPTGEIEYAGCF